MSEQSIFGYFSEADQTKPAYEPALGVPCPYCLKKLELPVRTTSLMLPGDSRSYFYRAHLDCANAATEVEVQQVEGSLIDSRAEAPPHS